MIKALMAGAALMLAPWPGAVLAQELAQENARLDCVNGDIDAGLKESLGASMAGSGEEGMRQTLLTHLATLVDVCAARHGIAEAQKSDYFDYSLARISREWLVEDLARLGMASPIVDKALDFGPGQTNPDLSGDMTEEQIKAVVQAYAETGVDTEKVDSAIWEKVGAYAAATSIYWNKRQWLEKEPGPRTADPGSAGRSLGEVRSSPGQ